jgi:hypothetical protein
MGIGAGIGVGMALSSSCMGSFSGLLGALAGLGVVFVLGILMIRYIDKLDKFLDWISTRRSKR